MAILGGGLGNRLLGLASMLALAELEAAELSIIWPMGPASAGTGCAEGFHAPLAALYEPPCQIITSVGEYMMAHHLSRPVHYSWDKQRAQKVHLGDFTTVYTHGPVHGTQVGKALLRAKLITLRPAAPVRELLQQTAAQLPAGEPYDGLLVRCHGHPKAVAWRAARRFIALLPSLQRRLFICCDDPDVTEELSKRLAPGQSATCTHKTGQRNSYQELIAVAADIVLLSQAAAFYGTPFSAMTEAVTMLRRDQVVHIPGQSIAHGSAIVIH